MRLENRDEFDCTHINGELNCYIELKSKSEAEPAAQKQIFPFARLFTITPKIYKLTITVDNVRDYVPNEEQYEKCLYISGRTKTAEQRAKKRNAYLYAVATVTLPNIRYVQVINFVDFFSSYSSSASASSSS